MAMEIIFWNSFRLSARRPLTPFSSMKINFSGIKIPSAFAAFFYFPQLRIGRKLRLVIGADANVSGPDFRCIIFFQNPSPLSGCTWKTSGNKYNPCHIHFTREEMEI